MTRQKESISKTGINGDLVFARKHNRTSGELEGRLRKKLKKRKGLKTGSRHSEGSQEAQRKAAQQSDPRLGSKKKIPLIAEAPKKLNKQERRASAEQELAMLENDAQLNVLLDRIDNGEKLGAGLQKYVDQKLDRIEILMKQLGLFDGSEELEQEQPVEPVAKAKTKAKAKTDDDLLSQFENLDLDDYKD
ncbi:Der GTPase-activating protein YihI [Vibrio ostreae]|uniref:Der GTPase-activating protein YihI n=1 Tax=Vibrio ostreae TaxID=2841925 RepID=A0A975YNF6_9VIBR|nr:Der GTPase-activating protein YihI [Vibrio ostreae]QXO17475.1 GTPase-activating protein [Vibrio ostreae]